MNIWITIQKANELKKSQLKLNLHHLIIGKNFNYNQNSVIFEAVKKIAGPFAGNLLQKPKQKTKRTNIRGRSMKIAAKLNIYWMQTM